MHHLFDISSLEEGGGALVPHTLCGSVCLTGLVCAESLSPTACLAVCRTVYCRGDEDGGGGGS